MKARGRVLVAYSGGVDSALVARIARDALGGNALAVITDTETLPRRELEVARHTAEEIGIELRRAFLGAGGQEFHALPCLNEDPRWIEALAEIVRTAPAGANPAAGRPAP